jgi:hypothetical protein
MSKKSNLLNFTNLKSSNNNNNNQESTLSKKEIIRNSMFLKNIKHFIFYRRKVPK